jgi:hypothetical protein
MIIAITPSGQVELRDAENFRAFKIVDEAGGGSQRLEAALSGLATLTDDGKAAWVVPGRLPALAGAAATDAWRASLAKMIAAAGKFGWVNEADGTVRAHIETVTPS